MKKNKQTIIQIKSRDFNVVLAAKGEINLGTKTVKDKTKYSRKEKHKKSFLE